MDDFEEKLKRSFKRWPAPPGLKPRIMARHRRVPVPRSHVVLWQRMAASLTLAAMLGGAAFWHQREERLKGEAARQQVLTALRITDHALDNISKQLAAHGRASQE